jgi:hypothetical protein
LNIDTQNDMDPLAFASGWSLGERAYRAIRDDLIRHDVRTIVEFGSGTSTLRLSRDLPNATILSLESELQFSEQTRGQLKDLGGRARVEVALRPIIWQRHSLGFFRSYQPGSFPGDVDAVLIDGPPITTRRGREACLYQAFPYVRIGARIYLDDYCRQAEQQVVRNWLRAYPRELVHRTTFAVDHQVAVLEKVGERRRPRTSLQNTVDSAMQNSRSLLGRVRRVWK